MKWINTEEKLAMWYAVIAAIISAYRMVYSPLWFEGVGTAIAIAAPLMLYSSIIEREKKNASNDSKENDYEKIKEDHYDRKTEKNR